MYRYAFHELYGQKVHVSSIVSGTLYEFSLSEALYDATGRTLAGSDNVYRGGLNKHRHDVKRIVPEQ